MSKDLFKEAIADAKTVKETAIASAKAALEEAFTPHLKNMFSAKLEQLTETEEQEEGMEYEAQSEAAQDNLEEMDLEEILKELEALEEADPMMDEAEEMVSENEDAVYEEESEDETEKEESEEEIDFEDMDMETFTDLVRDALKDLGMTPSDSEMMGDEEATEDEMSLEPVDEINVDELLAELELLENPVIEHVSENASQIATISKELEEALDVIAHLRTELNEVNLLNAKLLYTNKIFKAKNLTEAEKIKVLTTFDKATTVKEAKLVFETLSEGLATKTKPSSIKESLGSASKAMGVAPKQQIIETNEVFARMQRLAGIK
jgi:hypothetical protein